MFLRLSSFSFHFKFVPKPNYWYVPRSFQRPATGGEWLRSRALEKPCPIQPAADRQRTINLFVLRSCSITLALAKRRLDIPATTPTRDAAARDWFRVFEAIWQADGGVCDEGRLAAWVLVSYRVWDIVLAWSGGDDGDGKQCCAKSLRFDFPAHRAFPCPPGPFDTWWYSGASISTNGIVGVGYTLYQSRARTLTYCQKCMRAKAECMTSLWWRTGMLRKLA